MANRTKETTTTAGAIVVVVVALVIQATYLVDTWGDPAFTIPIVDAGVYHQSAVRFAAGQRLIDDAFWQPPLFPLLLGCLYRLTGPSVLFARVVLGLLACGSCLLVWWITRRIFSPMVAVAAGLILACYGPFLFFSTQILPVGLTIFLDLVALAFFLQASVRPHWIRWSIFGLAAGLSTITVPNAAILLVLPAIGLFSPRSRTLPRRAVMVGLIATLAGFTIPVAAVAFRNHQVSGQWVLISTNGGINLYVGNNPKSEETVAIRPGERWQRLARESYLHGARTSAERDSYFLGEAFGFALHQPAAFFTQLARKSIQLVHAREIPRNVDLYALREHSPVLRGLMWRTDWFAFPFGLLAPFAALGMLRSLRDPTAPSSTALARRVLGAFASTYSLSVILFFVSGRYRMPIIPVLAIFAAAGGATLWELISSVAPGGQIARRLVESAIVLLVVAAIVNLPVSHPTDRIDFRAELATCLGDAYATGGRLDEAETHLRQALVMNPRCTEAAAKLAAVLADRGQFEEAGELLRSAIDWDEDLVEPRVILGTMLRRQNRMDEAASVLQEALRIDPTSPEANVAYADVLILRGETNDAIAHYATAIEFGDHRGETHLRLADALMRQEHFAEAIRHYRSALARMDADAETLNRVAWLMATCSKVELRDCRAAIQLAGRACELTRNEHPVAMDTLAAGYAECGDWDAAVSWARRAVGVAQAAGDAAVVESVASRLRQYEDRRESVRRGESSLSRPEMRSPGN